MWVKPPLACAIHISLTYSELQSDIVSTYFVYCSLPTCVFQYHKQNAILVILFLNVPLKAIDILQPS